MGQRIKYQSMTWRMQTFRVETKSGSAAGTVAPPGPTEAHSRDRSCRQSAWPHACRPSIFASGPGTAAPRARRPPAAANGLAGPGPSPLAGPGRGAASGWAGGWPRRPGSAQAGRTVSRVALGPAPSGWPGGPGPAGTVEPGPRRAGLGGRLRLARRSRPRMHYGSALSAARRRRSCGHTESGRPPGPGSSGPAAAAAPAVTVRPHRTGRGTVTVRWRVWLPAAAAGLVTPSRTGTHRA